MDADASSIDWEKYLPLLTLAANTAMNKATKQSPFFTMMDYDARLPLWSPAEDVLADDLFAKTGKTTRECVWEWHDRRRAAQRAALSANQQAIDAESRRHSLLPSGSTIALRAGDEAWAELLPLNATNKKFAPKYERVIVTERIGRDTYKVKRTAGPDGKAKFRTLHAEHLKPMVPPPLRSLPDPPAPPAPTPPPPPPPPSPPPELPPDLPEEEFEPPKHGYGLRKRRHNIHYAEAVAALSISSIGVGRRWIRLSVDGIILFSRRLIIFFDGMILIFFFFRF